MKAKSQRTRAGKFGLRTPVRKIRSIAIVDVENLLKTTNPTPGAIELVSKTFYSVASVSDDCQTILACSHHCADKAFFEWNQSCVRLQRSGVDGADLALIEHVRSIHNLSDFGHVVSGSGDHLFTDLAWDLRDAGHTVHVVARRNTLARSLKEAANFVSFLPITSDDFELIA